MGCKSSKIRRTSSYNGSVGHAHAGSSNNLTECAVDTVTKGTIHDLTERASNTEVCRLIRDREFDKALKVAQERLERHKTELGGEDATTLESMFLVGVAFHGDRKVQMALETFQQMLSVCETLLGRYHVDTIAVLDAVCEELCNLGRYEECLKQLSDQQSRCAKAFGPNSRQALLLSVEIGHLYRVLGRQEDALKAFQGAFRKSKATYELADKLSLSIANDVRLMERLWPPGRKTMSTLLQASGLTVPDQVFPNSKMLTMRDMMLEPNTQIMTSLDHESLYTMHLRLGTLDTLHVIPPRFSNMEETGLGVPSQEIKNDNSFAALIARSVEIVQHKREEEGEAGLFVNGYIKFLQSLSSMEDLLVAQDYPVWFFQLRQDFQNQSGFPQWNPTRLKRYVLLPVQEGFVNPKDCAFVSHYWASHSDPNGAGLEELKKLFRGRFMDSNHYIWVDWTCLPQGKRTAAESKYFTRILATIPRLVRDCAFLAHLPKFRPRLWVLFEVAAFFFSRSQAIGLPCIDTFKKHIFQMEGDSVRDSLVEYGYACTNGDDYQLVATWLEILIALRSSIPCISSRRRILNVIDDSRVRVCKDMESGIEIDKERGLLKTVDKTYQFSPLPFDDGVPESVARVTIPSDYETRLATARKKVSLSFDEHGKGEHAQEYEREGDYKIAEAIYRDWLADNKDDAFLKGALATNLHKQHRYAEALEIFQEIQSHPDLDADTITFTISLLKADKFVQEQDNQWKTQVFEVVEVPGSGTKCRLSPNRSVAEPALCHGLRRSWLQRLDQSVWEIPDPVGLKSRDEIAVQQMTGPRTGTAQDLISMLLADRQRLLGPTHPDTRRTLSQFAEILQIRNITEPAHTFASIASAVCDQTLGKRHPEALAALASLGVSYLMVKRYGVARTHYRKLLERTLTVVDWDDEEAFAAKFMMQAVLDTNQELYIVQDGERTTVRISAILDHDQGISLISGMKPGAKTFMSIENAEMMMKKFILSGR